MAASARRRPEGPGFRLLLLLVAGARCAAQASGPADLLPLESDWRSVDALATRNASCCAAQAGLQARILRPSAGSGDDGSAVTASTNTTKEPHVGPGETFGMVLLIVAMSIFCVGTFGSIIIGNLVLSKRGRLHGVDVVEP
mmetsp:Transcript_95226/g.269010  ORF Transcript_95226/g.269010 Transcript_95226/m.269010 type:complete len:141 (+) Transcript_95226:61-483(+)